MGAKAILGAMVAATAIIIMLGRRSDPAPAAPPPPPVEAPWLSREAAAQIIGPDGTLGPLFDGVVLGGTPPLPELRARIQQFARANHVSIDFEIADGEVAAVRFEVTFGGCCGYEGADVLAMRLRRPESFSCCGCKDAWIDDWATTTDDGMFMRARVRVNRVAVRWERALALPELVERADELLGKKVQGIAARARDRWVERDTSQAFTLEQPYPFARWYSWVHAQARDSFGLQVHTKGGEIDEVSFALRDHDDAQAVAVALRNRWGRPRVRDGTWTWKKPGREITAELESSPMTIRLVRRD